MANFLRDQQITNITIKEAHLRQINDLFLNRVCKYNSLVGDVLEEKKAFLYYTIRFDGKGYRVYNFDDLLSYFQQAKEIERIIFTIETGESLRSARVIGTVVELKLDQKNPNNCILIVTADDCDTVESSFYSVQEVLSKCTNRNGWVRTAWMEFIVQISGISLGFIVSLWIALKLSSKLTIENSFVISFFFILLIFSNIWSYLNRMIHHVLNHYFPNLEFYRPDKERFNWFIQAVITTVIGAIVLWFLGILSSYIVNVVSSVVVNNPY